MDYVKKYNKCLLEVAKTKKICLKKKLYAEEKSVLSKMGGEFITNEDYQKYILPYWQNYGLKPQKMWFDLYCNRDKKINKYMIPADLYYNEILPYLNNIEFWKALADKNLYDIIFSDIDRPKMICKNANGFYYDENNNIIDKKAAVDILYNYKNDILIKPAIGSHQGSNICVIERGFNNKKDVKRVIAKYNKNFTCQEKILQHKSLSKLNPNCVQTIRVVSVLYDNKVHIVLSLLRIGDKNSKFIANPKSSVTAGIYVELLDDGHLYKKGLSKDGKWVEEDLYGNKLSSHKIPCVDKIKNIIEKIHPRLPHFKCIGWDFTIDENEKVLLIEFNVSSGIGMQYLTGKPAFGKLTPRILQDYFKEKNK